MKGNIIWLQNQWSRMHWKALRKSVQGNAHSQSNLRASKGIKSMPSEKQMQKWKRGIITCRIPVRSSTNQWRFRLSPYQKGPLMMECHNVQADSNIGLGVVAMHWIPCGCEGCLQQLAQPWKPGINPSEQPQYAKANKNCMLWPIFEGLKDWHIVQLHWVKLENKALDSVAEAEIEEAQDIVRPRWTCNNDGRES